MKLNYRPYKRSAHCSWYGEFLIIGTWLLGSAFIILSFAAFVNIIAYGVQQLLFK